MSLAFDPDSGRLMAEEHVRALVRLGDRSVNGAVVCRRAGEGADLSMPRVARRSVLALAIVTGLLLGAGSIVPIGAIGSTPRRSEVADPLPSEGAFHVVGKLRQDHRYGTATLLADGRVLVIGGGTANPKVSSGAELFDPASGSSRILPAPRFARSDHAATLLSDGRVLIVGGQKTGGGALHAAEVWDPATERFRKARASLSSGRNAPLTVLLADGRVLVVGGLGGDGEARLTAEVWSPGTRGTLEPAGALEPDGCRVASATRLGDDRVLVIGTCGAANTGPDQTVAWLWDSATSSFSPAGSFSMALPGHTATLLDDGRVLLVGGDCERPTERVWLEHQPRPGLTLIWDAAGLSFTPTTSIPGARCAHSATLLPDGRVLVVGGWDRGVNDELASAVVWNPVTEAWHRAGELPKGRATHDALPLADGTVLIVGDSKYGGYQRALLIWKPR